MGFGMLKDVLDQLGSLTLEEKRAVVEAVRARVLSCQVAAGRCENTWAMLVSAPQPF